MMSEKSAQVLIGGKVYTLSGFEEVDYLHKLATHINQKNDELLAMENSNRLSAEMKTVLLEINLADDYFKAKEQIDKLAADLEVRDREIYDIKHDLISNQVKTETLEEQVRLLEEEKKELVMQKTRLEASLEDALLGSLDA